MLKVLVVLMFITFNNKCEKMNGSTHFIRSSGLRDVPIPNRVCELIKYCSTGYPTT